MKVDDLARLSINELKIEFSYRHNYSINKDTVLFRSKISVFNEDNLQVGDKYVKGEINLKNLKDINDFYQKHLTPSLVALIHWLNKES